MISPEEVKRIKTKSTSALIQAKLFLRTPTKCSPVTLLQLTIREPPSCKARDKGWSAHAQDLKTGGTMLWHASAMRNQCHRLLAGVELIFTTRGGDLFRSRGCEEPVERRLPVSCLHGNNQRQTRDLQRRWLQFSRMRTSQVLNMKLVYL